MAESETPESEGWLYVLYCPESEPESSQSRRKGTGVPRLWTHCCGHVRCVHHQASENRSSIGRYDTGLQVQTTVAAKSRATYGYGYWNEATMVAQLHPVFERRPWTGDVGKSLCRVVWATSVDWLRTDSLTKIWKDVHGWNQDSAARALVFQSLMGTRN